MTVVSRTKVCALCLTFLIAFAGCRPSLPPLDRAVAADSPRALTQWRLKNRDALTPQQWKEFDGSIQEINYSVMVERRATGSTAIEEEVLRTIQGRTVRDVVDLGWSSKLARLEAEKAQLETDIKFNSRLKTKPGDDASAEHLASARRMQADRLTRITKDIADIQQILNRYSLSANAPGAKRE